ncbi:MAG: peptidase S41 [Bacteroidetes bacterium]|nr:peptidase S41 [Bacteroidota bacterium]
MPYTRQLIFAFLFCPLVGFAQTDTLASKVLSAEQMRQDFNYLRRLLIETHPGLYRYTPKVKMQSKLDSIYNLLDRPLPFYEFYKIITALASDIRCAHTNALPNANLNGYIGSIQSFPFFMFTIGGKPYVIFNGSTDTQVTLGYELTTINGHAIDSVMSVIKQHYWSDGFIETSKNTALQGGLFCLFYYALIERPDQFRLEFKDLNGQVYRTTVPAQKYGVTERAYVKNKINKKANQLYNQRHKKPWRLYFPNDAPSTALLRFDAFGGKGMNTGEEAKLGMRKFMDESLKKINTKNCTNLIVDVRSNSGGWDNQGIELFTYLMKQDSAVRYYRKMHAITDSSEFLGFSDLSADDKKNIKKQLKKGLDGTFSLLQEFSPDLLPQQPKPNRFKGNIYILQNERSYSTTSEFLAACKAYQVGTIVGIEAGGAYEGGNGGSFIHVNLPHSKIQVGTPLVYYNNATRPGYEVGRGVMPDHIVEVQPKDLVNNFDRQMAFVKSLITSKEKK